jgi:mannose-6-phosphate isomerase-like protein (cupin superfamily)
MKSNFGGNIVESHDLSAGGKCSFSTAPYEYFHLQPSDEPFTLPGTGCYTLFVVSLDLGASLHVDVLSTELHAREALQLENSEARVSIVGGGATLLVAGSAQETPPFPRVLHHTEASIKKVVKPWGHELWFQGAHQNYAFKEIFIKAGTKTSLQYHRYKQETNVLLEGSAVLHYKADDAANIDAPPAEAIGMHEIQAVSSIDVTPFVLHRIEAKTDILLYEVSTPFLDDVVRVSDDSKRPDGRIEAEHSV